MCSPRAQLCPMGAGLVCSPRAQLCHYQGSRVCLGWHAARLSGFCISPPWVALLMVRMPITRCYPPTSGPGLAKNRTAHCNRVTKEYHVLRITLRVICGTTHRSTSSTRQNRRPTLLCSRHVGRPLAIRRNSPHAAGPIMSCMHPLIANQAWPSSSACNPCSLLNLRLWPHTTTSNHSYSVKNAGASQMPCLQHNACSPCFNSRSSQLASAVQPVLRAPDSSSFSCWQRSRGWDPTSSPPR